MIKLKLIVLAVLFSVSLQASGSTIDKVIDPPHESEHLSQKEVRTMIKDSYGYLWVGTQDGLNRFDGYNYSKFSRDPFDTLSLQYDIIDHLLEDKNRKLWIGTRAGLDIMDLNNLRIRHIRSIQGVNEVITKISGIKKSGDDILLGFENSIYKISEIGNSKKTTAVKIYENDQEGGSNSILNFKNLDNDLWIVGSQYLHHLNIKTGEKKQIHGWSGSLVRQVYCLDANRALLMDDLSLYLYEDGLVKPLDLPGLEPSIRSVLIDQHTHEIYFGTRGNGLWKANYQEHPFGISQAQKVFVESIDDQSVTIQRLYKSDDPTEDLVWCGTRSHGLYHYSKSKNLFQHILPILRSQLQFSGNVYSILPEKQSQWIGTDQGLYRIQNQVASRVKLPTANTEAVVYVIKRIHDDQLLIGTNLGVFVQKKPNRPFEAVQLGVQAMTLTICELDNGQIWLGTTRGLFILDQNLRLEARKQKLFTGKDSIEVLPIGNIIQDSQKRVWVGTIRGLFYFRQADQNPEYLSYHSNESKGLIDDIINSVYEDSGGQIWLTTSKGISKLVDDKPVPHFAHYTQRDGLSNPYVYGMMESRDHRLWMSTNQGISVFDPQSGEFSNYSAEDGLIYDEFNSGAFAKDSSGRIYFGGIEVLVAINNDVPDNNHLPPVVLCDIRIDGVSKFKGPSQNQIVVRPNSKAISLVVAALDYTNPLKNQYAYRIVTLDKQWIKNGTNREINLYNLPYGKHIVEIKASNNQNHWNEEIPLSLELNILTPWYKSKIWYLTLLGLALLIIWGIHEYRVTEKINLERAKAEENERVRKMASQDLHDEFGNSLTRISVLTELIRNKLKQGAEEGVQAELDRIFENTNRLYQGTKDFIWSIRMDSDLLFESAIRIKDYADDLMSAQGIEFETIGIDQSLDTIHLPQGSSRQVVVIFKEAIANTLKHAKATKAVFKVEVLNANYIQISWKDNGVGIKKDSENQGNGLQNMKSRAKMIGADLTMDVQNGTEITLIVPTNKKNGK